MRILNNKGFTMIELLVSIAIIITTATIVVAVITASFRGSTQTAINENLRLEGNAALSQLGKMIQFADGFEGVVDGEGNEFDNCTASDEDATFNDIRLNVDGVTTTISCKDSGMQINSEHIFDTTTLNVENCAIKCSQLNSTDSPTIGIEFDLSRNNSELVEQRSSMHFEKNIKMRNLSQ
jgi:type II secretory pathway pseudopilin PulG